MFMIPQDITAYHTSLNVSYSYSLPDGTEKEVTEEIYLPNTWEVNKAYNYVINIEPDIEMINVSPSVVDWDSPTETPAIGNDIAEAVDLGSSYKWASHDFGAVSPCDMGLKYSAEGTRTQNYAAEWGNNWRCPTVSDWQAILSGCTWTEEEINGRTCYRATNKEASENSVLFSNRYYWTYARSGSTFDYYRVDIANISCTRTYTTAAYWKEVYPVRLVSNQ